MESFRFYYGFCFDRFKENGPGAAMELGRLFGLSVPVADNSPSDLIVTAIVVDHHDFNRSPLLAMTGRTYNILVTLNTLLTWA